MCCAEPTALAERMKTILKRPRFICSPPVNTEVPLLQGQCQEEMHGKAGEGHDFSRKANSAQWNAGFPSWRRNLLEPCGNLLDLPHDAQHVLTQNLFHIVFAVSA